MDMAKCFLNYFNCPLNQRSIFKVLDYKPQQQCLLWLKDEAKTTELQEYLEESDELACRLINKSSFNKMLIEPELKKMHESLRLKLNNQRNNGIQSILRSHLYELMPETQEQLAWFPILTISLDSSYSVKFYAKLRKKNLPRRVA